MFTYYIQRYSSARNFKLEDIEASGILEGIFTSIYISNLNEYKKLVTNSAVFLAALECLTTAF